MNKDETVNQINRRVVKAYKELKHQKGFILTYTSGNINRAVYDLTVKLTAFRYVYIFGLSVGR